jgi:hypothetical protein
VLEGWAGRKEPRVRKIHTLRFVHAGRTKYTDTGAASHMASVLLGLSRRAETRLGDSSGCPGLAQIDRGVLLSLRKLPPTSSVFPIELKTNMAAFVYFLIGMPTSWIMSATAAAPGHSLHKQQLEKQDRGHCLGDFP